MPDFGKYGKHFHPNRKGLLLKETTYKYDKYLSYSTVFEESKVLSHLTLLLTNTTND